MTFTSAARVPTGSLSLQVTDTMVGGRGRDEAMFSTDREIPFEADLQRGVATGAGRDALSGIENLTGFGRSTVLLSGDRKANQLVGSTPLTETLSARGRGGDDVLYSWSPLRGSNGPGPLRFVGGGGEDLLVDAFGRDDTPDVLRGGADNDQLWNEWGGATLYGGPGEDELMSNGYGGSKSVFGGGGVDTLIFARDVARVHVDLGQGSFEAFLYHGEGSGSGTVTEAENVRTESSFTGAQDDQNGDIMIGDAGPNRFESTGGVDQLDGAGGDDVLVAGTGDDDLDGGDGSDMLDGGDGSDSCRNGEDVVNCEA